MSKTGICLLFFLALARLAACQQIYMERTFGGARFETDSLTLSVRDVLDMMYDNQKAHDEFRKARANYTISGVLGFSGGLLVVVPLVTAAVGGKPEWTFAAAGGGLILFSIPFMRNFYRHAENALEDYNMKYQSRRVRPEFYFTGTGCKVVIRF